MRFASYARTSGTATWGAEIDGTLYDLGPGGKDLAPTLKAAIERGLIGDVDVSGAPESPVNDVEFLPVVLDPGKIVCVGVNYRAHQVETGRDAPAAPTLFTRFADTQMGHGAPAVRPDNGTQFDYEGEMALVIGKPAHRVREEDAWSVIAGYSAYNDFSVRDWQRATSQWLPGKNFPNTGAFGPFLVPTSEVSDVTALTLQTRVNGDVRQSASLADLVFTIPQLIAHISGFTPLAPGDVIVTGTPGGVGLFMDPPGLLAEGDEVEVEITGLGTLVNRVVQG
jgi:2-keto-4-pentenoate hydratase/2-oxohepta-3-ene-1,7-dioic acid hydratase in catechol pathway